MGASQDLPSEFDPSAYRSAFPRLAGATDELALNHFQKHGKTLGVAGSKYAYRRSFLDLLASYRSILEIGPYNKPVVSGRRVKYFDILDKKGLDHLAATSSRVNKGPAPHIDYVSPTGDLSVVDRQFDAVVSSHCIEHQPDLVRHLKDVARILVPGGHYFILCPDKRYCFDHFVPESDVAAVMEAHRAKRSVHSLESVIRQRTMTTHNVPARHWAGDHGGQNDTARRLQLAIDEFEASNGGYIDVHAWRFTPDGFRRILDALHGIGLSPLKPVRVYNTPKPLFEFAAVLQNG